ncbi:hypothetical protein [Actinoplanes sp. NPDC089786]|uniref:helix-turn-helix domain-containing protein n=1 Tax=Actinoplanes sp. NPDC089786 TaxID=3155185 RepID=UPI003431DE3E
MTTTAIRQTPARTAAEAGTGPAPAPGTAGSVKARRGGPMTPIVGAERAQLRRHVIDLYVDQQLPMREVAATIGRSYGLVNKLLDEGNVTRRPRGMRHRKTPAAAASGMPSPGAPRGAVGGQRAVPARAAGAAGSGGCDRVMSR